MKVNLEIGTKIGKLTVIKESEKYVLPSGQTNRAFLCKCDCGNEKKIRLSHLIRFKITTCGTCERALKGFVGTRLHNSWKAMKNRVASNYFQKQYYYDKGIGLCPEWEHFNKFMEWSLQNGYKENLTIDRIDNSKGYYPSNCRWVTQKENNRNQDNTTMVVIDGIKKPLRDYCEIYNQPYYTIRARINRGWDCKKALETPIKKGNYKTSKKSRH